MMTDNQNSNLPTQVGDDGVFLGHYKGISISNFAKDLLLFGNSRVVEVCDAYNMSAELFEEIVGLPAFKKEMRELRALVEASPNALIQLKARTIVERGVEELQSILYNSARDADRIKAMELLVKIAGVQQGSREEESVNSKPQASGLVLNVQLGPHGLVPPLPANRNRPLRRVDQISQVIDVK